MLMKSGIDQKPIHGQIETPSKAVFIQKHEYDYK